MQKPATPNPSLKVSGTLANSATPTDVQPSTLGNINNTTFFIKTQNGSVFLLSNPFINTDPTGDGTTIRRNGSTPIIADNGSLTANIEFATFGYGATGYVAARRLVQLALGPDVTTVGAPGLGTIINSNPDAGGTGITGSVYTDAAGLFRATVTFNGAGGKTLHLTLGNESYVVTATVT